MLLFSSLLVLPLQLVLALAGAVAPRVGAALALIAVLALPWAIGPELVLLRGVSALVAVLLFMRAVDLHRARIGGPYARAIHALSVPDLRYARRAAADLNVHLLMTGSGCAALSVAALVAAAISPSAWEPLPLFMRWGFGTAAFYLLFEAVDRLGRTLYGLGGYTVEPTQRAPILATSLADFWGRRWNAIVRRWLAAVVYIPFARRGARAVGRSAAFIVSAALHTYMVLPALGWLPAAQMGAFFLVHGALVWVEGRVGITRLSSRWGRAWTLLMLAGSAPLFMEPLIRIVGLRPLP